MQINWNKKYTTIAAYSCIVLTFAVALIALMLNFEQVWGFVRKICVILNPAIYGFVIAFLINPVMVFCEKHVFSFVERKKSRKRLRRVLSVIAAFLIAVIFISAFVSLLVPQIISSYKDLEDKMQGYVSGAQRWVSVVLSEEDGPLPKWLLEYIDIDGIVEAVNGFIAESYTLILDITPYIVDFITQLINQLKNALIGIIFSVYFLLSKEKLCAQIKKTVYAFSRSHTAARMVRITRLTKKTFEGFIIGKIVDSIIIGILTFFVLMIFGIPYYPLVSVIVGVTNVIPFFGPFIGAIPCIFIIFIADPIKSFWFAVIILIIQQIDGNIIGPKILGQNTNLSAIWVMFAIIFMSGILGITGMFIGVPIVAVLYALFVNWVNKLLISRGRSRKLKDYYGDNCGRIVDEIIAETQPEKELVTEKAD